MEQTTAADFATCTSSGHANLLRKLGDVRNDSRTGDPATGDFSDTKVIRRFGDVPDDLSAL
jgi:hypothetical protein